MKADLIAAASKVVPNQSILINMISRRVRQLSLGHRPMVEVAPDLRAADIATGPKSELSLDSSFSLEIGVREPVFSLNFTLVLIGGQKRGRYRVASCCDRVIGFRPHHDPHSLRHRVCSVPNREVDDALN